ncbi:flagellar hook-length control protein FliK [Undibacterium crateris]|uniref:flagellar hook-length control protein FliK n=1 Tax=Undibacterium crateris TaxID=2528175 RepID=UPI00138A048E|nr:flagellar hook-length control protein FliK [Undibacterium crateris]NDI86657.1 hypothetical protein [Undibacterium crateris]
MQTTSIKPSADFLPANTGGANKNGAALTSSFQQQLKQELVSRSLKNPDPQVVAAKSPAPVTGNTTNTNATQAAHEEKEEDKPIAAPSMDLAALLQNLRTKQSDSESPQAKAQDSKISSDAIHTEKSANAEPASAPVTTEQLAQILDTLSSNANITDKGESNATAADQVFKLDTTDQAAKPEVALANGNAGLSKEMMSKTQQTSAPAKPADIRHESIKPGALPEIETALNEKVSERVSADIKPDEKSAATLNALTQKSEEKLSFANSMRVAISKEQESTALPASVTQASPGFASYVQTEQAVRPVQIPIGVHQTGWDKAIGEHVISMAASKLQQAELSLNPPDLGPLKIILSLNQDQANATFITAQPEVRQALEASMPKLRDMMNDAGMQLAGFNVQTQSSPSGQGQGQGQQQASFQPENSIRRNSEIVRNDAETTRSTTTVGRARTNPGAVDTFA